MMKNKTKKEIKPFWCNYECWEDYNNKMYENECLNHRVEKSFEILTHESLKSYMKKTTIEYPIATKVNFTNKMFNPISWLGQATCNLLINATAKEVCQAWMKMSQQQQTEANNIAKEVIKEWRDEYENILK